MPYYKSIMKFSDLSARSRIRSRIIKSYKKIVSQCGGDEEGLLNYIIYNAKGSKSLRTNLINRLLKKEENKASHKLRLVMTNLADYYNKTSNKKKRQLLSCLSTNLSNNEIKQYGFNSTNKTLSLSRKHATQHGIGSPLPSIHYEKFDQEVKDKIIQFFNDDDVSYPCRYKSIKDKRTKEFVTVRYLKYSISHCYSIFNNKENLNISKSTFTKLKPNQIKKAKKQSDKCEICELGKIYIRLIIINILNR